MNDYRFMKFPGKKFQARMTTDKNTIKKLSNILNMYTGYDDTPIYIPTLLKAKFRISRLYKIFIGIAILSILAFQLNSWMLLTGFICMSIVGILMSIFYTEAADYKILNTLIANSNPDDIMKYSEKLNQALYQEKKSLIKNK